MENVLYMYIQSQFRTEGKIYIWHFLKKQSIISALIRSKINRMIRLEGLERNHASSLLLTILTLNGGHRSVGLQRTDVGHQLSCVGHISWGLVDVSRNWNWDMRY